MLPVYAFCMLALASAYPQPPPQETNIPTEITDVSTTPLPEVLPTVPTATNPPPYPTIQIFGKPMDARHHAKIPLLWQILFGERGSERLYSVLRSIGFVYRRYHADV